MLLVPSLVFGVLSPWVTAGIHGLCLSERAHGYSHRPSPPGDLVSAVFCEKPGVKVLGRPVLDPTVTPVLTHYAPHAFL